MQQEATDELERFERHDLGLAVMAIILPAEGDMLVSYADQAGVGDRDAMGVAAEIGQHLSGTAEGRLGIDDPFDAPEVAQAAGEGGGLREPGKIAEGRLAARR